MNKILTIALTIYKPEIEWLRNYFFSFKKINDKYKGKENPFQFLIISDNPELTEDIEKEIINEISNISNLEYVPCSENKLRVGQFVESLDKVEGKFVKLADPDDFLDPEETIRFVNEVLVKAPSNSLIINSYRTTSDDINEFNFNDLNTKKFYKNKSYNPNSTYPTEIFKKCKWNFRMLIWSDDLLGFILLSKGAKVLKAKKYYFYINKRHAGVSVTKTEHQSMMYYNDSITLLEKAIEVSEKENISIKKFNKITSKPSIWFFSRVAEDLNLNSTLSRQDKIDKLNYILKIAKKTGLVKPAMKVHVSILIGLMS